jgi:hypothetical protein
VLNKVLQIAAIILVLTLVAQPLAACMTPGHTMTAAEHACCMKMATMCESSAMPASHSCCKQAVSPQVITLAKMWSRDITAPAILVSKIAPALPQSLHSHGLHDSDSPPGNPPRLGTLLRI